MAPDDALHILDHNANINQSLALVIGIIVVLSLCYWINKKWGAG
jgi:hypothetical protein